MTESFPNEVHLVGIGGDGMLAIAQYLVDKGRQVSGSDMRPSAETARLSAQGVKIYEGHAAAQIAGASAVVVSDAIPPSNSEVAEARLRDLPVFGRAAFLQRLASEKETIFVAGSHGKSSTTAMIAKVLETAGLSPSFVIGADVGCLEDRRARFRSGSLFVAEACEAFNNLGVLRPDFAIVTNIDDDHLEHYGTQARLDLAFRDFLARTRRDRGAFANGDDPGVRRILADIGIPVTTFGFDADNGVRASSFVQEGSASGFDLCFEGQKARVKIQIPGRHAVYNALACAAVCLRLGVSLEAISVAFASFRGVARRWDDHGTVRGIRIVDDYAHHPTELAASIETALSARIEGQRLVIAYQPQLVSRTKRLFREIAAALARCDEVLLLELDPGGEKEDTEDPIALLVDEIGRAGRSAHLYDGVHDFVERAEEHLLPGDFLLIAGAGSIRLAARGFLDRPPVAAFRHRSAPVEHAPRRLDFGALFKRLANHAIPRRRRSVVETVRHQVETLPDRCAIAGRNETMSYRRLDEAAEAFARVLFDHGVELGSIVGVSLPSSIDLVVVILAIAKSGAVYLPIGPGVPLDRVKFMLDRANSRLLVTAAGSHLDTCVHGVAKIHVDRAGSGANRPQPGERRPPVDGRDTAYICFTSGSTGRPKGVPIRHESLAALIEDIVPRFAIDPRTRSALNTSIGFDVSLAEIWATLCGGGTLCVTDRSQPLVGASLANFIASMAVTHLAVTPTVLRSMPRRELPSLKCIVAAGEACPPDLVDAWGATRAFFNAYGPTEATIYATVARCRPGAEITIGAGLGHVAASVLTEDLLPAPMGEVGELCLAGIGVSQGYLGDADQPAGGFSRLERDGVATPIYRTGDLVRQRPDGELTFVGRRDRQIKLLGNRIELDEIENVAIALTGVQDAAACLDDREGRNEIVCFIAPSESELPPTEDSLRERLAAWLPSYMLPHRILVVDKLLVTANGKKDRKATLASHDAANARRAEYAAARTDAERKLAEIWDRLFPIHAPIGVYDDFASLGGDSLKSLEIIAEIEAKFDLTVPPGHFGRLTTVTNLAVLVDDLASDRESGHRADNASGFYASRIYRQQRHLTAGWEGARRNERSLVRSFGPETAEFDMFVCVQYEEETQMLAEHLGPTFRVHGMRSGHLVMPYTPDTIHALSSHYLHEMEEIAPVGRLLLAGICQGGTIAHAMAKKLTGSSVPELLVLVEQARLPAYAGRLAFFYSEQGYLNPFSRFESGLARFDEIYGTRYTVDLLPGPHGTFHRPPHVSDFVAKLRARLEMTGTDPGRQSLSGGTGSLFDPGPEQSHSTPARRITNPLN